MSDNSRYDSLDLHCQMIIDEYRELIPEAEQIKEKALSMLRSAIRENNLMMAAVEGRIKTEGSLIGKLELKGHKYHTISDITDIIGVRIITFYTDDVDKIAAIAENVFEVDWENSVDKRKMHEIDRFGYNSLHYICSVPKSLYYDPECPLTFIRALGCSVTKPTETVMFVRSLKVAGLK